MKFPIALFGMFLSMFVATSTFGQTSNESDESDRETSKAVMLVLDEFMAAFNRMDVAALEETYHFPHYRLANGQLRILSQPGEVAVEGIKKAIGDDWHRSAWDRRRIVHLSEAKVHVDTRFTRYRKDGSTIASYDSLYVLTREHGEWGIRLRSSFAVNGGSVDGYVFTYSEMKLSVKWSAAISGIEGSAAGEIRRQGGTVYAIWHPLNLDTTGQRYDHARLQAHCTRQPRGCPADAGARRGSGG